MDSQESSSQQSGLDSLRTVEFRQTLRGYHIDDVDEYLERVAVEVDALRDQMRVASDRLRQAAERIGVLEQQLDEAKRQPAQPVATMPTDDALQRTLQMAQRFVEQTQAEARSEADATLASAQERAGLIVSEAEERARRTSEDAQRQLREDVTRLEGIRGQLSSDVETIARHLESERTRLRSALGELASWVEETLQPASSLLAPRTPGGAESGGAGQPASPTMARPAPSPTPQSLASSRTAAVASPSTAGIPSPFQGSGPAAPGDTGGQVSDRSHNALA